jgi:aconitate hydratase
LAIRPDADRVRNTSFIPNTTMALKDPFKALRPFSAGGKSGQIYSVPALEQAGLGKVSRLPVSIRLVLESVLRNCDGVAVTEQRSDDLAAWNADEARSTAEIPFVVARIVLQDFTGVPLLVDLAAMRAAVRRARRAIPRRIEPARAGRPRHRPLGAGRRLRHRRRLQRERGAGVRAQHASATSSSSGAMQAFNNFSVVPPGIGIVPPGQPRVSRQAASGPRHGAERSLYPDTLVGTDSHTTMINGLGVVGWGVGGIEAEAGMLGQPVYFLIAGGRRRQPDRRPAARASPPPTWRSRVTADAPQGEASSASSSSSSAPAPRALPLADRATIANMAPEYGATMGFFPIDAETPRLPPRHRPRPRRTSTLVRGLLQGAGPVRHPADAAASTTRRPSSSTCRTVVPSRRRPEAPAGPHRARRSCKRDFSRSSAPRRPTRRLRQDAADDCAQRHGRSGEPATATLGHGAVADRRDHQLHQHLAIPRVMLAAGLARQEGRREGPQA